MRSFRAGLFAGGDAFDQIHDKLDLERWFRLTKGHERRIHGHRHAGVRILQEGPTLVHALDPTTPTPNGSASTTCCRTVGPAHLRANGRRSTVAR